MTRRAYILAGATATGKSAAAQLLAEQNGLPVISADAMLVYRGMDIGTAKPTAAERARVHYSGLDIVTPAEPFSTGLWLDSVRAALASLPPETTPVICGGTGLYLKALLSGLDAPASDPAARAKYEALFASGGLAALQDELRARAPERYAAIDSSNPRRLTRALEQLDAPAPQAPRLNPAPETRHPGAIILTRPRAELHARIAGRVKAMFAAGLEAEISALRRVYPVWSATASKAIGYAETLELLDGRLGRADAVERIAARTRQLAKRQETWFRHQLDGTWLEVPANESPEATARRLQELWNEHGPAELAF